MASNRPRSGARAVRASSMLLALALALALALGGPAIASSPPVDPSLSDARLEAGYAASKELIHYPALDAYLATVVQRLQHGDAQAAAPALRLHALESTLPYAFVLGNGAAYVSTGLLARLDDETQLAALIALPFAATVRNDAQTLDAATRARRLNNLVPNLLLIAVTAGLGAPSIVKADEKARAEREAQTQLASDQVALRWLAAAGYDPAGVPAALRQLRERLEQEQLCGPGEFSDPVRLATRADALERALADAGAPAPAAGAPVDPRHAFRAFAAFYALRLAAADLDTHPAGVAPVLDRLEAAGSPTGWTCYVRAELLRRSSAARESVPAAIAAYERAVAHADAPPAAWRELAFLYRRLGDGPRARAAFGTYLDKAPTAADAPIIRTYLEDP